MDPGRRGQGRHLSARRDLVARLPSRRPPPARSRAFTAATGTVFEFDRGAVMAELRIEKVTKVDAARRQLSTAIRLFFERRDTISIHTLVAAAQGVMHDLLEKRGPGKGSFLKSGTLVRPEKRAEYFKLITGAQNFFKHADREPVDAVLDFYPEPIELSILDVVDMLQRYTGRHQADAIVFLLWFGVKRPGILEPNELLQRLTHRIQTRTEGLTEDGRKQRFLELLDEAASWGELQGGASGA